MCLGVFFRCVQMYSGVFRCVFKVCSGVFKFVYVCSGVYSAAPAH